MLYLGKSHSKKKILYHYSVHVYISTVTANILSQLIHSILKAKGAGSLCRQNRGTKRNMMTFYVLFVHFQYNETLNTTVSDFYSKSTANVKSKSTKLTL